MPASLTQTREPQPDIVATRVAAVSSVITTDFGGNRNNISQDPQRAPTGPFDIFLSTEQLAARLQVSVDTISRWEAIGKIPRPVRSKPAGSGRGRQVVRHDLWCVCRRLFGKE